MLADFTSIGESTGGENEAIILAQELAVDAILLDDREGRQVAQEKGLRVIGAAGLLVAAAREKLIDMDTAIERLKGTNFRFKPELLRDAA
jgi:predicted nucleic acid-binding protein